MKILATLLVFFSFANASAKSISDNSMLSHLMYTLSDTASGGASLAMFQYNEDFIREDFSKCKELTGKEAAEKTIALFDEIVDGGESTYLHFKTLENSKGDIYDFFGNDTYYHCKKGQSVFMGYNYHQQFISKDLSYRVEWITGYED